MHNLPMWWKKLAARLVRVPGISLIMQVGIRVLIPRQRVGVSAVALNEKQQVLLLRHVFHPFLPWGLPGGWLNRHEDPAAGALRELREEIGLTADLGPILQATHDPQPPHLTIAYLAWLHPGKMVLSPEILEAKWFSLDTLPPIFPFMASAIETAVQYHSIDSSIHSAPTLHQSLSAAEKIKTT